MGNYMCLLKDWAETFSLNEGFFELKIRR